MKLRQKLAVVLASAMAVTAVPVVTMAASTNSLTKETLKVKKEIGFYEASTANALRVKFTDHISGDEVFYLDLDNAKWDEDVLKEAAKASTDFNAVDGGYEFTSNGAKVVYERQNDDTMKVTVSGLTGSDPIVQLPLFAKTKDGDAKVSVVSKGGSTTVSQGTFVFATTAEKKISLTVANDKTFYTNGKLADITIEEAYKGSLAEGATFTIELADSDFYFTSDEYELEGKYGFSSHGTKTYKGEISKTDDGKITITLPKMENAATAGTFILKGLEVKSTNKKPEEGDFLVDIKGDDLVAEKTDVKIAKVSQYGIYLKMKDDKAEDVKAGRIEEVEFEIGENVEDSMITGRDFDITLENGHFDYKKMVKDYFKKESDLLDAAGVKTASDLDDDAYKKAATKINSYWLAQYIMDNDGDWKTTDATPGADDKNVYCEAEFDADTDGKAIVETITFTLGMEDDGDLVQNNGDCDKVKFKTNICVPVDNKDKEKVTMKISGRGIENEATTTAINIVNPFNVTFEQAVLKTGLQGQVAGSIALTETDKDCFQKGDITFKIKKDDEDFGIYLTDVTVEVSDGLKGTKSDVTKGSAKDNAKITLTLNRASKEAATLTFKDMKFTTDRTVPEGTYDLEIGGTGVDADGHTITVKDFIKISTTNTQDITANGLAKGTAKFVIGESKYTLNDKEVTMDAPSYIQDPGYTMVPVRYVANAFGVSDADILFGKGTVTIFAGERTISLTTGSNIAVVNGNNVAMATKVINKDGRTYVPAGQIASLLGIKSAWDSSSKTATFENN